LIRKSIEYLGYIISEKGISPDTSKIEKIKDWPFPRTGTGILSFLGFCNYYRRLIPHFAEWAAPLYAVSREVEVWETPELLEAFGKLKEASCSVDVLKIPDPAKTFILETDASNVAVGAVLKQKGEEEECPVYYYSQILSKSEQNYSVYEKELYAVVRACESFRVFLLGTPFILRSDHKALASLFCSDLKTSPRVVRWIMRLQEYPFTVEYIPGKENIVADALSRIPWPMHSLPSDSPSDSAAGADFVSDVRADHDSGDEEEDSVAYSVVDSDFAFPVVSSDSSLISVEELVIEQ
jgi:hypothetical protein